MVSARDVHRYGSRLRLLIIAAVLVGVSYAIPIGPDISEPAGAWGYNDDIGCGAHGWSGQYVSDWVGTTWESNCGDNWVRFRSWGFYGPWVGNSGGAAIVTDGDPTWWGGADHSACLVCANFST